MLSKEARAVLGGTLVTVPTIVYGGLTVLSVVTHGMAGTPAPPDLTDAQTGLYRAGHAHAGVLVVLSLVLQVALDSAVLPSSFRWVCRVAAPAAAILVSGGFFGIAHLEAMRWLLYLGATLLVIATVGTGVGLLRPAPHSPP